MVGTSALQGPSGGCFLISEEPQYLGSVSEGVYTHKFSSEGLENQAQVMCVIPRRAFRDS